MSKSVTNNRAGRSSSSLTIIPGLGVADLAGSGLPDSLAGKVSTELELFAERIHQGLLAAAVAVGLEVFDELLQSEVSEVAGPKGRHNPDRQAVRHGSERAKVPMGGRLVDVARPRVRAVDGSGEIGLEWFEDVSMPYLPRVLAPIASKLGALGFAQGMRSLTKIMAQRPQPAADAPSAG